MYIIRTTLNPHFSENTELVVDKITLDNTMFRVAYDDCLTKSYKRILTDKQCKIVRELTLKEIFKFCQNPKEIGI